MVAGLVAVKNISSNLNQIYLMLSIAWFVYTKNSRRHGRADVGKTFVFCRLPQENTFDMNIDRCAIT